MYSRHSWGQKKIGSKKIAKWTWMITTNRYHTQELTTDRNIRVKPVFPAQPTVLGTVLGTWGKKNWVEGGKAFLCWSAFPNREMRISSMGWITLFFSIVLIHSEISLVHSITIVLLLLFFYWALPIVLFLLILNSHWSIQALFYSHGSYSFCDPIGWPKLSLLLFISYCYPILD